MTLRILIHQFQRFLISRIFLSQKRDQLGKSIIELIRFSFIKSESLIIYGAFSGLLTLFVSLDLFDQNYDQ